MIRGEIFTAKYVAYLGRAQQQIIALHHCMMPLIGLMIAPRADME